MLQLMSLTLKMPHPYALNKSVNTIDLGANLDEKILSGEKRNLVKKHRTRIKTTIMFFIMRLIM